MSTRLLTNMRREEQIETMLTMPDRDMCEMIRAHFESHPTLPGEKALKDEVNQKLKSLEPDENGFTPTTDTPFNNEETEQKFWSEDEKKEIAGKFAETRIRETPLKEGNHYLDFRHYDPTALKRESVDEQPLNDNSFVPFSGKNSIYVDKVNVELQKNDAGEVYVLAEQLDGTHRTIGSLPDSFLKNNPMNVDCCSAELEIADYSNGQMKNISTRIIVDTDLMSGDAIDLDDSLLSGLNQEQDDGLNQ